MNLHRLVIPPRPRPRLHSVRTGHNGMIHATVYMPIHQPIPRPDWNPARGPWTQAAMYQHAPDGTVLRNWVEANYPTHMYSAPTRAYPWRCPAGVLHRRYFTVNSFRADRFDAQNPQTTAHHCEHTIFISPVTGLAS